LAGNVGLFEELSNIGIRKFGGLRGFKIAIQKGGKGD